MYGLDINLDYDLSKICRSCLCCESTEMSYIFEDNFENGISLKEMISSCTQIELNPTDGLPNKICMNCTLEINTAYNVKKKYEHSDFVLRQYLTRNKIEATEELKVNLDQQPPITFEIKPEISYMESDPLVNEKYFSFSNLNSEQQNCIESFTDINIADDFSGSEDEIKKQRGCMPDTKEEIMYCEDDEEDEDEEEVGEEDLYVKIHPDDVQNYIEYKPEEARFYCKACIRGFVDKKGINQHMRLHTGEKLKHCNICSRGFIKGDHLRRHIESHNRNVNCKYCEEKFSSYNDHKIHMAKYHSSQIRKKAKKKDKRRTEKQHQEANVDFELPAKTNKLEIVCKICDCDFEKIYDLRNHLKVHTDPATFETHNIYNKHYLFEDGIIPDNPINFVINLIYSGNTIRLYQILNRKGNELTLSDSDSEDENVTNSEQYYGEIIKKELECTKCHTIFDRFKKLEEHCRTEHTNEELCDNCPYCNKSFTNPLLLQRHLKKQCENVTKKFVCEICKEKFMWQISLNKHINFFHKPDVPEGASKGKSLNCPVCKKLFSRPEHIDRHIKIHNPLEKKFECPECEKKFNRKDNLRSHMKVHSAEREENDKHLCVYCGRSFSNSSNLIVHMRRHTGEKPYKCDLCDKGFPRSSDLQCHRRTHTGEKPCLCTICGKGFSRSNKLVRHMRIHTGVRPYECTYCDRAFTQSNDLTLHIRRHTGEKPYVCGVCGDRFIQGTALKAHQRTQGHIAETQISPFASISVNNPNRFTNANRVNRIGTTSPNQQPDLVPRIVKPVKARVKTNKHLKNNTATIVPTSTTTVTFTNNLSEPQKVEMIKIEGQTISNESTPETTITYSTVPVSSNVDTMQARVFHNNVPQTYLQAANGISHIPNGVLAHFDLHTILSLPQPFNNS